MEQWYDYQHELMSDLADYWRNLVPGEVGRACQAAHREGIEMFYTFRQHISYGYFDEPTIRIIEADSADEANSRALQCGIYFDGVEEGIDCHCCGDRWWRVTESNAAETPPMFGSKTCEIYPRDKS